MCIEKIVQQKCCAFLGECLVQKLRILFAAACFMLFAATASAAMVTTTGQGGSERDALHDAMRNAIEQQVGVLVDSKTYVQNYKVIHDQIFTHSEGYIKSYSIVNKQYVNAIYSVTIQADVASDILNTDLMNKLQKQQVVRANMQDPRVGVIVMENDGTENSALESKLMKGLANNGFSRIVDMRQIDASVKNRISDAVFEDDMDLAQMLKSQFNADYLVMGYIDKTSDAVSVPGDIPFVNSLQNVVVTISIRMLNTNTGEVVYADSFEGQAFDFGAKAEQEAMKKASKNIVKELSRSALKKAANPEQHITLIVTNGALGTMSEAYNRISSISGVNGVYVRSTQAGNIQMDVDYYGTAYDLAQALERSGIGISEMNSEYIRI